MLFLYVVLENNKNNSTERDRSREAGTYRRDYRLGDQKFKAVPKPPPSTSDKAFYY